MDTSWLLALLLDKNDDVTNTKIVANNIRKTLYKTASFVRVEQKWCVKSSVWNVIDAYTRIQVIMSNISGERQSVQI